MWRLNCLQMSVVLGNASNMIRFFPARGFLTQFELGLLWSAEYMLTGHVGGWGKS